MGEDISHNSGIEGVRFTILERSGLSKDKKKLAELVKSGVETSDPKLNIRDPYIFEFLGLKPKEEIVGSEAFRAIMSNARRKSSQAERTSA